MILLALFLVGGFMGMGITASMVKWNEDATYERMYLTAFSIILGFVIGWYWVGYTLGKIAQGLKAKSEPS